MNTDSSSQTDEFVNLLTEHQVDLRAYLLSSLGDYADAADVLQRTNLVLWKKASQFRTDAKFLPWAFKIARYEVLAFRRDSKRDRHVFSQEVVELMTDAAIEGSADIQDRRAALKECVKSLSEKNRELLLIRYNQDRSLKQVADMTGRTVDAVKSLFLRIRKSLARCIERRLNHDCS